MCSLHCAPNGFLGTYVGIAPPRPGVSELSEILIDSASGGAGNVLPAEVGWVCSCWAARYCAQRVVWFLCSQNGSPNPESDSAHVQTGRQHLDIGMSFLHASNTKHEPSHACSSLKAPTSPRPHPCPQTAHPPSESPDPHKPDNSRPPIRPALSPTHPSSSSRFHQSPLTA